MIISLLNRLFGFRPGLKRDNFLVVHFFAYLQQMWVRKKKMAKNEKQQIEEIVSYTPPQLYTGKEWYVGFMAFDPAIGKLHRKRIKINRISGGITAKRKYANDLIKRLNDKLSRGWNPWIEAEYGKSYNKFDDVCDHYRRYITKLYKDDVFREETYIAYTSFLRNLCIYNESRDIPITYIYQLNSSYVVNFLDYIYVERENTAQTRDNYLSWIRQFSTFLIQQQYVNVKPSDGVPVLGRKAYKKKRTVIEQKDLIRLQEFLSVHNKYYLLACYVLYYCFIRPKEMSKIKLEHISIKNRTIYVPADVSKNREAGVVTLPRKVINLMIDLSIFNNPSEYYLFSTDFMPGNVYVNEKRFRDYWIRGIRKKLHFPDTYKFYSLKDSGITSLLRDTKIDKLSVRDQARHSSILITDIYTPHDIQEANFLIETHEDVF